MIDFETLTIADAHEHLKNGDITPADLVSHYLKKIESTDGDINAYLEVFDDAMEQAKTKSSTEQKASALWGIPIALKDNILINGKKVSAASKILEGYRATYDSTVAKKLKKAGAIFLGRTNMDEFAMGASTENSAYGPTKNPHDITRVAGGSSGGSAAVVAGGMALAALGSDTAGSIRQPSAFCGTVGLKPTYGSVSRSGLIALGSSFDVIGPITKTVTDAEIIFNAIKGKDLMDATSVDEKDFGERNTEVKTIGVPRRFLDESGADERVLKNFYASVEIFKNLGYTIKDIELPNVNYAVPAYYVILPAEASSNLARFDGMRYGLNVGGENVIEDYFKTRGAGFGPEPRRRILIGTYVLSAGYYDAYYNKAVAVRGLISNDFKNVFGAVDLIALPTTAGPAFKLGEKFRDPVQMYLEDIFTVPANHAGLPAISLPSGFVDEGTKQLPLGLQLYAPHMQESRLFSVGKKFCNEKER
jgi:aspartyl-tRNA(Asn)/glutamyl-tRNA(Gln) amidotransferase subunit A